MTVYKTDSEPATSGRGTRALGDVVNDLTQNTTLLLRQEIALAKRELSDTLSNAVKGVVPLVIGGFIAHVGFLALVAAAILGLALVLPGWAAALIVGGVILLIGGLMVLSSVKRLSELDFAPQRTVRTLKEDAQLAKGKMS